MIPSVSAVFGKARGGSPPAGEAPLPGGLAVFVQSPLKLRCGVGASWSRRGRRAGTGVDAVESERAALVRQGEVEVVEGFPELVPAVVITRVPVFSCTVQ